MKRKSIAQSDKTLATKIADYIRDDILSGRLMPGYRLSAKEVADRYHVSPVPVREAFNLLSGERLLEMNAYRGAIVKGITEESVSELFDLLCSLEILLTELCMHKGYSKELIEKLKAKNAEYALLQDDSENYRAERIKINLEFHLLSFSPCNTHEAFQLYTQFQSRMGAIRRNYFIDYPRLMETLKEHEQLIRAIESNDLITALAVTRQHSYNARKYSIKVNFNK